MGSTEPGRGQSVIVLEVPGRLECRSVVLGTVAAACRLLARGTQQKGAADSDLPMQVVSAVGEAYNNIVLHGYSGREPGTIHMTIENCTNSVRVEIRDTGVSFDPTQVRPPDLAALPESGLGIFVMRSMVDELSYVGGSPNVLTLVKRLDGPVPSRVGATGS
jgi:serine/threonine-protein kinase RsbW